MPEPLLSSTALRSTAAPALEAARRSPPLRLPRSSLSATRSSLPSTTTPTSLPSITLFTTEPWAAPNATPAPRLPRTRLSRTRAWVMEATVIPFPPAPVTSHLVIAEPLFHTSFPGPANAMPSRPVFVMVTASMLTFRTLRADAREREASAVEQTPRHRDLALTGDRDQALGRHPLVGAQGSVQHERCSRRQRE